ncbi:MAG: galactose-1-phosphate uridylyltransferase [Desulfuromonadales bacterium]|nr:galactose-1-phosphate uridylyltransferase [Desulfuromonadales bacterium]
MSELRFDIIKQHWVIIATERGRRPRDFQNVPKVIDTVACPFCYGYESKTPPEIFAIREYGAANTPGWKVRVIPNKYPALRVEGDVKSRGYGLYNVREGIGAHEVIIETPDHKKSMADFSQEEITDVLKAYRARFLDLRNDFRLRYMVLFKNHGVQAGASLSHSHSQLIAVPLTPPVASMELEVSREFYQKNERCIFCDLIEFELNAGVRVVSETSDYIVTAPYASCFPFELRLYPKQHLHDFAVMNDMQLSNLALAMKDMLQRIKVVLGDPPYNFILHNSPPVHNRPGKPDYWGSIKWDYHWHIELVPRLTQIAGFEWGTGFYINSTSPEDAAAFLRDADLSL